MRTTLLAIIAVMLASVPFAAAEGDIGDVIGPPDPGSGCKPNCVDVLELEVCVEEDTPEALRPACEQIAPTLEPDPEPCRPSC